MIQHITTDELKGMVGTEGLVLQGCGGDPAEWQKGINETLTEAGILRNGGEFKDIYVFEHDGITNIFYPFESLNPDTLDMGKLAVWRLQNHENFAGTWLSDYFANRLEIATEHDYSYDAENHNVAITNGAHNATEYCIIKKNADNDYDAWKIELSADYFENSVNDDARTRGTLAQIMGTVDFGEMTESAVIIQHAEGDFELWQTELPPSLLENHINEGFSSRGTLEQVLEDMGLGGFSEHEEVQHLSGTENDETPNRLLSVFIEKWLIPDNGGFTMPLPTSPDELRPFLDDIEVIEWQDIAITNIRSDIKGLGDKLQEILTQEDMSPYRLNELNYLATRIEGLSDSGLEIFAANIEAGRNCDTIADIINLTFDENLNCFDVQPAFSEEMYGEFQIEMVLPDKHADAFHRLNESDDPADSALAAYIEKLEAHVDKEALGRTIIQEEDGVITGQGYLTGGDGLRGFYLEAHDIPIVNRIYSPPMPMVENTDLSSALLKMHALGGEFMQRADKNFSTFMNRQGDELLLLTDGKDIRLMDTMSAYFNGSDEHNKWKHTEQSPETRAFIVLPADNGDKFAIGSLVEIDFIDQKRDILNNSIWFDQVEIVKKDGTEQLLSRDEWESLSAANIENTVSWRHLYDESALSALASHVEEQHSQRTSNVKAISTEDFLADINSSYMGRAENPQPDMLRITREAAAEMLARGDADVYRLFPNGSEKMSPMDAVKSKGLWYSSYREFAIKREDATGLYKWAERKTSDIMRQAERGEHTKVKHKNEEL